MWLLALFAGEGGGGFNFNRSSTPGTNGRRSAPDLVAINQQVSSWLSDHIGLIVAASLAILLLTIAFFVLAAVCEGAVVRAAAEHDAERPFGLGLAWRVGMATMGAMIRFRLLLIALALPLLVLFAALVIGIAMAIGGQNGGEVAVLGVFGLLLVLAAIPYLIALFLLDRVGTRALVLEQLGAVASLRRAYTLLTKRLGRLLLVGLLAIGVAIVVGIGLAIIGAILVAPVAILAVALYASGSPAWVLVIVLAVLVLLPILLVISAFLAAQSSTYWTLAFRRLEIERPPAYAYAYPPPQIPQQPPGLPTT
jgi:hypothetical protein